MKQISFVFQNKIENRLRAGWRILGQQLLLVCILLVLEDYASAPLRHAMSTNGFLLLNAITGILAFGGSVWLAGKWLDHRPFAEFGFHFSRAWWRQLFFGMLLGAGLMGMIFLMELATGQVRILQIGYTVEPGASLPWALLVMFLHYIGISFTEEILVRGYLLRNLLDGFSLPNRNLTTGLALLVSSVIFALPHAGNPHATWMSTLLLVGFGVMCALAVLLTGELAIPLGLHLTWNFFQGHIFGFPVSGWAMRGGTLIQIQQQGADWFTGGAFGPEAGAVGLIAMLFGIGFILLWSLWSSRIYVKRQQLPA